MSALYVIGKSGRKTWHIARYTPSGYGVGSLCGKSWREGDYRTHGAGIAGPFCKTCERLAA